MRFQIWKYLFIIEYRKTLFHDRVLKIYIFNTRK